MREGVENDYWVRGNDMRKTGRLISILLAIALVLSTVCTSTVDAAQASEKLHSNDEIVDELESNIEQDTEEQIDADSVNQPERKNVDSQSLLSDEKIESLEESDEQAEADFQNSLLAEAEKEAELFLPTDGLMDVEITEIPLEEDEIASDIPEMIEEAESKLGICMSSSKEDEQAVLEAIEEKYYDSQIYNYDWEKYSSYYAYNRLPVKKKLVWDALVDVCLSAMCGKNKNKTYASKYLDGVSFDQDTFENLSDLSNFLIVFKYSNPQYFFLRGGFSYSLNDKTGKIIAVKPNIYENMKDASARQAAISEFKDGISEYESEIVVSNDEKELIKSIHNTICEKVIYNTESTEEEYNDGINTHIYEETEYTQSAYSVFVKQKEIYDKYNHVGEYATVCAGYTLGLELLANSRGLECMGVTAPSHAYNKICVDDIWYNIDVTWGDQASYGVYYRYYLKSNTSDAYNPSKVRSHGLDSCWSEIVPACTHSSDVDTTHSYNREWYPPIVSSPSTYTDEPEIFGERDGDKFQITIELPQDADFVYYTTGSTESETVNPSSSYSKSNVCSAAETTVLVDEDTVVKAIATHDGYWDSDITTYKATSDGYSMGSTVKAFYNDSSKTLTIKGTGSAIRDDNIDEILRETKNVVVEKGVTSLGEGLLCVNNGTIPLRFDSLSLPSTIKNIGANSIGSPKELVLNSVKLNSVYSFPTINDSSYVDGMHGNYWYDSIFDIKDIDNTLCMKSGVVYSGPYYGKEYEVIKYSCGNPEDKAPHNNAAICYVEDEKITIPSLNECQNINHYEFAGWFYCPDGKSSSMDENTKIKPGDVIPLENLGITESGDYFSISSKWNPNQYQVTFDGNDGVVNGSGSITVSYGENYGELPTATREGYKFDGWYDSKTGGNKITKDSEVKISDDQTLYAHWTANEYTITFDATEGLLSGGSSKTVTYGEKYGELPVATREEYKFDGWYDAATNGNKITKDTVVVIADNHRLYAHWTLKEATGLPVFRDTTAEGDILTPGVSGVIELKKGTRVHITSDTKGAQLYYTVTRKTSEEIEGTNPTITEDCIYQDAIVINEPIIIKAIAVKEGYRNSEIASITCLLKNEADDWMDVSDEDKVVFGESANADMVPNALWLAGVQNQDYTGNAITMPNLRVYNNKTLLKANTDYTVKYTNNTKAGTATITITGKGNYAGTISKNFQINKLCLGDGTDNSENLRILDIAVPFNNKVQKGTTTVTYLIDGKAVTLKNGTDFTYSYLSDYDYKTTGTHTVKIVGKGNYEGIASFEETIEPSTGYKIISKMKFSPVGTLSATGAALTPDVEIKEGSYTLVKDVDYELDYQNNILPGTANVIVTGKGNYIGTKVVTFKISAISISKATVSGITTQAYTGEKTSQSGYILKYKKDNKSAEETLHEGTDFTVSYLNEINAGSKAQIIFTGINRFSGTLKKNYTITVKPICDDDITLMDTVIYEKGGAKPKVTVKVDDVELREGIDYILLYSNNNRVHEDISADTKKDPAPKVTITGKGNYSGKYTRLFAITGSSLTNVRVEAGDIIYANKAGICKPSITVYDKNNAKLSPGTDYDKNNIVYVYNTDVTVSHIDKMKNVTYEDKTEGTSVDLNNDVIPAGAEIKVTVYGKNFYEGSEQSTVFRFVKGDIAKAAVKIDAKYYTGSPVVLSKDDITSISIGKTPLEKTDFEIIGYNNNTSKGTATVTLRGVGNYGGIKNVNFTIGTKTMTYRIIYDNNNAYMLSAKPFAPNATGTMKVSNTAVGAKLTSNAYKRNGYVFSGWNTKTDGTGKDYTNFEKFQLKEKQAAVETFGTDQILYAQWTPVIYKIKYSLGAGGVNGLNPDTYTIESEISFVEPTREGYVFDGWYSDSKYKNRIESISKGKSGNLTLYAKWIR